jgi:hypothetical protein
VLDDYNLPFFHMVDCAHGNPPFDKMSMNERIDAEKRMIKLINDNALFGVVVSVNESEFDSWGINEIGSAYTYCCWQALAAIKSWISENNFSGEVSYFFEQGHEHQSQSNSMMDRIFKDPSLKEQYRYLTHSFVDKKKVRPIQSADILAWLHANWLNKVLSGNHVMRKDFEALTNNSPHNMLVANRMTMAPIIGYSDLLKGREPRIPGISGSFSMWRFWNPF